MPQRLNQTEDEIFGNHIAPYTQGDDDAHPQNTQNDPGDETNAPAQTSEQDDDNPFNLPQNKDEGGQGDSGGSQSQPNGQQPQQRDDKGQQKPQKQGQDQNARNPQDLVDPRTGQVIAKGGRERRFYEKAQRAEAQLQQTHNQMQQITGRVKQLETENQTLRQASQVSQQFQLSPEETIAAGRLMAAWKSNPVETVKFLLTQAKAAGHNIDGVGSSVDAAAIKAMVNEAIAPFRQDRDAYERQRANEQKAEQEYAGFMSRFPDAQIHDSSIARLLQRDPHLSLDAAYFMLKSFYAEHGLDWNVPLEQHKQRIAAEQQGGAQQSRQSVQPTPIRQMPNGRTQSATVEDHRPNNSADDSWEDIIRESLRAAG